MNKFRKMATETNDAMKRSLYSFAARAEEAGYSAKVTPRGVIVSLNNRKVSKKELKSEVPDTDEATMRRIGGKVKVRLF